MTSNSEGETKTAMTKATMLVIVWEYYWRRFQRARRMDTILFYAAVGLVLLLFLASYGAHVSGQLTEEIDAFSPTLVVMTTAVIMIASIFLTHRLLSRVTSGVYARLQEVDNALRTEDGELLYQLQEALRQGDMAEIHRAVRALAASILGQTGFVRDLKSDFPGACTSD